MSKKLNKHEAKALIKRYLDLPKIGDSLNAKRLQIIVDLMDDNGDANLQQVVEDAFDGAKDALNILSKTIEDVYKKANTNGFELQLVRDNFKGRPLGDRTLWMEGDEVMVQRLLEEMMSNLMLPESSIESHAMPLNKKTIVICYAQKDKEKVSELKTRLEERVHLYSHQKIELKYYDYVLVGEITDEKIAQNIEKCDFVLCCESPAFYADKAVKKHYLHQENEGKQKLCIAIQHLGENANRQICIGCYLHLYEKPDGTKNCYTEIKGDTKNKYAADLIKKIIEKFDIIESEYKARTESTISKLDVSLPNEHYIDNKAEKNSFTRIKGKGKKNASNESPVAVAMDLLNDWLNINNNTTLFALLGQYGMGKTFTAKVFAKEQIEKYKKNRKGYIPIYFDLRDFDIRILDKIGFDIWDIIGAILHKRKKADEDSPLTANDIKDIWLRFNTVFIFDGLDEVIAHIGNDQIEQMFISEIFKLVPDYRSAIIKQDKKPQDTPKRKMLLTCRTDYFKSIAAQASFFEEHSKKEVDLKQDYESAILLPFDESQIKQYLSQVFKDRDSDQLYATLAAIHNLAELAERPVLLHFLGEIIDDLESLMLAEKKITTATVYDRIVSKSFERDNGKHEIPVEIKETLLEEIAAFLWKRADRRIEFSQLANFLSEYLANGTAAMKKLYYNKEEEALYKDLRNATLLVRSDEKDFGFSHTSVQEYFLARYIINKIQCKEYLALDIEKVSAETVQFCIDLIVQMTHEDLYEVNEGISQGFVGGMPLCRKLLFDIYLADLKRDQQIQLSQPINLSDLTLEDYTIIGKKDSYINLKNAKFNNSFLHNWKLLYVDLCEADFTCATLMMSHFQSINMEGANFAESKVYGKWRKVEVKDIKLNNANFEDLFSFKTQWPQDDEAAFSPPHFFPVATKTVPVKPHVDCGHTSSVNYCAVLNENRAISASYDNTLIVWDVENGKAIHHLKGHTSSVNYCAVLNEKRAISASSDKTLIVWDVESGKVIHHLKGHINEVRHCAVLNENRAISSSYDKTLIVWDVESGKAIHHLKGHTSSVNYCAVLNENRAISSSYDNTLIVWDVESGKAIHHLKGHNSRVVHCAVLNENRAISSSFDDTLFVWDVESGKALHHLKGHTNWVLHCAVLNENRAISSSFDNTLIVWDVESGKAIRHLKGHINWVRHCAVLNENRAISSSEDKTLIVWDVESGKAMHHLKGHTSSVNYCAVLNEKLAISASSDNTLIVWDVESGKAMHHLKGHINEVRHCAVLNEKLAISSSSDNTLIVWDVESGKALHHLKGHTSRVVHCAVLNENRAISASDDKTLIVWDVERGKAIHHLKGHTDWVRHCVVLNENRAISASNDKTLIVWDLDSGKAIHSFIGHYAAVWYCVLNGQDKIVSSSVDGSIRLWDLHTGQELMAAFHLADHGHAVIKNEVLTDYSDNAWEHVSFEGVDEAGHKKQWYFDEVIDVE